MAFRGLFPQAPSRTGELFFSRSVEQALSYFIVTIF